MKASMLLALILLAGVVSPSHALYKVTDREGRVTYTDRLPTDGSKVEELGTSGAAVSEQLPFELRQIAERYPVTLYTADKCGPCDLGRTLLTQRGIPYIEKTVNTGDDADAFVRLTGSKELPVLVIGAQQVKGFSDSEWNGYFDAAGYPKTSQLPRAYVQPPPAPLVVRQEVPPPDRNGASGAPRPADTPRPAPAGNAPPGFRF